MGVKTTIRRGLGATIGKQRTDRLLARVTGQAKRSAPDLSSQEIAYHLSAIREELIRSRTSDAGADILAELKASHAGSGQADKNATAGLQAIRRDLHAARTIPSVPIALRRRSVDESVDYINSDSRFGNVMIGPNKPDCLAAALRATTIDGMVCEFGVYKGESLTQIAKYFPDHTVHGFDSFVGLPESWSGTTKGVGAFDIGGTPPPVPVENVEFHVGFFDTTVPKFAVDHTGPFAFVHLDADLYSSTMTVIDTLFDWFVPGTVIVFDEYFGYHGWQNHEHKAFMHLLKRSGLSYEAISLAHMNLGVRLVTAGSA